MKGEWWEEKAVAKDKAESLSLSHLCTVQRTVLSRFVQPENNALPLGIARTNQTESKETPGKEAAIPLCGFNQDESRGCCEGFSGASSGLFNLLTPRGESSSNPL